MAKPSLPQGTRDFDAITVRKRQYIFNTIKTVFELYGFQPLETPAMENLETLMGKYGDEGDKLIFKILNNGLSDPKNIEKGKAAFENILIGKNDKNLTERALRYDLTIPFARYVAMNHGQLTFPFKRYQMQPVWRADRPQRGRYREFYQCDADVVGSKSLWNEIELANIYAAVFEKLGIGVEIRINSRKILAALAEICGGADKMMDITTAIDKLDKIGIEKVKEELAERGLNKNQIAIIEQYLSISSYSGTKIGQNGLELITYQLELFNNSELGLQGLKELTFIVERFYNQKTHLAELLIDPTLARGLNYYTGAIFEIKAVGKINLDTNKVDKTAIQMGSIGGGGRYDNLTGTFGVPDIAGVGISFGVDRIYDVMEELKLFPTDVNVGTQVLFFNLGETEAEKAFKLMQQLRSKGIRCELFHEKAKFDKQFKYADKKQIPYSVFIGEKELQEGNCVVKDLRNGVQATVAMDALKDFEFA